ncbi:MAG: YceI family protein [Saprospiraceae bacterium]|nr:YceI family protein [Saprospiraceae bacterium]
MKRIYVVLLSVFVIASGNSQKYFSKNAIVRFHSESKVEKIEALNTTASTVFDKSTGKVEFAALNNAFVFEKALMQEHFNENYMESTKYPKTIFKGKVLDADKLDLTKPGVSKVTVEGDMTMHGVTKPVTAMGQITVDAKGVHVESKFKVKCSDFNIEIPSVVKNSISNDIDVSVKIDYNLLNK